MLVLVLGLDLIIRNFSELKDSKMTDLRRVPWLRSLNRNVGM